LSAAAKNRLGEVSAPDFLKVLMNHVHALEKELKTAKYPSYTNRAMVQRGVKPGWLPRRDQQ